MDFQKYNINEKKQKEKGRKKKKREREKKKRKKKKKNKKTEQQQKRNDFKNSKNISGPSLMLWAVWDHFQGGSLC